MLSIEDNRDLYAEGLLKSAMNGFHRSLAEEEAYWPLRNTVRQLERVISEFGDTEAAPKARVFLTQMREAFAEKKFQRALKFLQTGDIRRAVLELKYLIDDAEFAQTAGQAKAEALRRQLEAGG